MSSSVRRSSELIAALLLAACGGTAGTAPALPGNVAPPDLPPPGPAYASLFVEKASAFPATLEVSADSEPIISKGTVRCIVSNVEPDVSDHLTMRLGCSSRDFGDPGLPNGAFSIRADGLWRVREMEIEKLELKLMDVAPVPGDVTQPPPEDAGTAAGEDDEADEHDSWTESVTVVKQGEGWCINSYYSARRESGNWTLCFGPTGIVGGKVVHHGYGSLEELTFGKAPP